MDQPPKHPSPASGASEASPQDKQVASADSVVVEDHDVPVVDLSLAPDHSVDDSGITIDYEAAVVEQSSAQEPPLEPQQSKESEVERIIARYVACEEYSKAAEVASLTERPRQASELYERAEQYGSASSFASCAGLARRAAELSDKDISSRIVKGYTVSEHRVKHRDDLRKEAQEKGDNPVPDSTEGDIDARIAAYEAGGNSWIAARLASLSGRTEYAINSYRKNKQYWTAAGIAEEAGLLEQAIELYQLDAAADEQKGSDGRASRYRIEQIEQRRREQPAQQPSEPSDNVSPSALAVPQVRSLQSYMTEGVHRPGEEQHTSEGAPTSAVVPIPPTQAVAPTQVNVSQVVIIDQRDQSGQPQPVEVIDVTGQAGQQRLPSTTLRELEQQGAYGPAAYLADHQGQTGRAAELARKQQYLLEQKGDQANAKYWGTYAEGLEQKLGIHRAEAQPEGSVDDTVSTPTIDEALYTAGEGTSTADVTAPPDQHIAQPPAGEYQPARPVAPRPKAPKRKQRAGRSKPASDKPRQQRQREKREPSRDPSVDPTPADAPDRAYDRAYSNPLTEAVVRLRQQQTALTAHANELYARVSEIESRGYQQRRDGVNMLVEQERTAAGVIPQFLQDVRALYRAAAAQIPGLDQRLRENLADVEARVAFAADAHATALREQAGLPHVNLFMYERAYRRFGMGISNFTGFLDTVEKYARQQPAARE